MKIEKYTYFFTIFMSTVYVFVYDIYTSALPLIQQCFYINIGQSQLTLAVFVIGGIFFAIPSRIISSYVGHKKTLALHCVTIIIGSITCLMSDHNIVIFYIGRFLQGIGASCLYIYAVTLPRNLLDESMYIKTWQNLTLLFYLIPSFASLLGGYIVYYGGWILIFNITIFISFLLFITVLFYFRDFDMEITKNIVEAQTSILKIFKNSKFLSYCCITSIAWAGMSVFYICIPYIIIVILGFNTIIYGWLCFLLIISGALANWMNIHWPDGFSRYERRVQDFSFIALVSSVILIVSYFLPLYLSIFLILSGTVLFGFSSAVVSVNSSTIAFLLIDKNNSLTASSIYGIIVDCIIVLSLMCASFIPTTLIFLGVIIFFFYSFSIIASFRIKTY